MRDGFVKVAAGTPEVRVADCAYNAQGCVALIKEAERLGVNPSRCLVFEDIVPGVLAGKRAGMAVIAVADAFSCPMEAEKRAKLLSETTGKELRAMPSEKRALSEAVRVFAEHYADQQVQNPR